MQSHSLGLTWRWRKCKIKINRRWVSPSCASSVSFSPFHSVWYDRRQILISLFLTDYVSSKISPVLLLIFAPKDTIELIFRKCLHLLMYKNLSFFMYKNLHLFKRNYVISFWSIILVSKLSKLQILAWSFYNSIFCGTTGLNLSCTAGKALFRWAEFLTWIPPMNSSPTSWPLAGWASQFPCNLLLIKADRAGLATNTMPVKNVGQNIENYRHPTSENVYFIGAH